MILGVGVDMVAVARMETLFTKYNQRFAKKILSSDEWMAFQTTHRPAHFLAKRFAAKEAFAKGVGTGLRYPVTLQNISVYHNQLGCPQFKFSEPLAVFLKELGVNRCHLSISDESEMACAFVVIEAKQIT